MPFCPESARSGIGRHAGDVLWYRRRFTAPATPRLHLHFGAVDYWATVWVNGFEVARHEGGHTPFTADISGAVQAGENELVVRAVDSLHDPTLPRGKQFWRREPEGIFYTATSGIWQTVWLEPLPERHIRRLDLRPDPGAGELQFTVDGEGTFEVAAGLDGSDAGRWRGPAGSGRLALDPVVSWAPGAPRLYDLTVTLRDAQGAEVDRIEAYFGLRTVETRGGRVLLNGRPLIQRLILDQGYWPDSLMTAPSGDHLRRDIELARAFGFNGARKHQKIEDPRYLYWADVLGFLVWEEMPSFHKHSAEAERRLSREWQAAVLRDRAHPSITAWVPLNESFGLRDADPEISARLQLELYDLSHRLDGIRPVSSNDGWEHARTDLLTLHDYAPPAELAARYATLERALEPAGRPYPPYLPGFGHRGEPVLVSEFGGLAMQGTEGWGYRRAGGPNQFLAEYGDAVRALMGPGPVQGFCYTQLTDVEQETNGLLTFEREPKIDAARLAVLTGTPKASQ